MPRVIAGTLKLLWAAGRRQLVTVIAIVALSARRARGARPPRPQRALRDPRSGRRRGELVGPRAGLVALAVLSTVLSVGQALVGRQHQLLADLTSRHAQARIFDVACAVELSAFDDSAFHDRVACANAAVFRAGQVAHGMLGLLQATAGVVGSLVALAALEPLLLPLALLAVVPGVLLSGRRANAHYSFAFSLTPRDRGYLASVQTAALDARAEHDLFARIRELFAARSVLLISHRFSTVRAADRIYVLDDGRIVESCSHAELMARAGVYAELYGLQASAYAG